MVKKVSDYLPQNSLRSSYYTIVYPYVISAIEVCGSSRQTQLKKLRRSLGKCLRIICKATRNDTPVEMKTLSFVQLY